MEIYGKNNLITIVGTCGAIGLGSLAGLTAWYWTHLPAALKPLIELSHQSLEIDKKTGEHISIFCKDGKLIDEISDEVLTLDQIPAKGLKESDDGDVFGWRPTTSSPYTWITYSQFMRRAKYVGSAFINAGLEPKQNDFVAIYSTNRLEWVLAEHGSYMFSLIVVALYDTLGPEACNYILIQTEAKIVICDTFKHAQTVLNNCVTHKNPYLKTIVLVQELDSVSADELASIQNQLSQSNNSINLISWTHFEESGKKTEHPPMTPDPDDLCSVCYTSGTTGTPKGVMLTHKNLLSMCAGLRYHFGNMLNKDTVTISFLPLAHMLERIVQMNVMIHGGKIGFFSGNIKNLSQDMKLLKPTLFPTVPRMLNKIHDKVKESISKSWIKSIIFRIALKGKEDEVKRGIFRSDGPWDSVFAPIRAELGGNVKFIAVGSAPLSPSVMTFARCVLGQCIILEGYGQTECGGVCTLQIPGDVTSKGSVGPPLPCNAIKMSDVPDMGYEYLKNGKGEICIKGPNVTQGYFKEPALTAKTIDTDGWLHTGDIGMWLPNGTLSIIDRQKNIFKLAQGEFVVPERIENIYNNSLYVTQVFVYGESTKSCLIAIVVPNEEAVLNWASKQTDSTDLADMADDLKRRTKTLKLSPSSNMQPHHKKSGMENGTLPNGFVKQPICLNSRKDALWKDLCRRDDVKDFIYRDMVEVGKKNGLHSFEQVKDIYLDPEMFSVENNLLTPTMKAKRNSIVRYFKPQLQHMYKTLD